MENGELIIGATGGRVKHWHETSFPQGGSSADPIHGSAIHIWLDSVVDRADKDEVGNGQR